MNDQDPSPQTPSLKYANYVLVVLVVVYVFNFIDRQILSILAEDIKSDLGVSDSQMGFLFGTVFAVFYAVFGIPLARFADVWTRRTLISIGLLFWSAMTALSGTAKSFPTLATYRIGVGIGEASASPAAYSMLSDYYPPRFRATVIAIYSSGVYIGGGLGMLIGGQISERWNNAYAETGAPFDLRGWQVAFLAVGIPGIIMALWMRTLREPQRGISEGLVTKKHPAPFKVLGTELASMIPPLNLVSLVMSGASAAIIATNLAAAAVIGLLAWGLIRLTPDTPEQWIALGIGLYVSFSWAQTLRRRDPVTFAMIFKSKAMIYTMLAFPTISFIGYGVGFWTAPLLQRSLGVGPADVGTGLGITSALGGLVGVTLGGYFADVFKHRWASGRLIVGYFSVFGTIPIVLWLVNTKSLAVAFALNFAYHLPSACWVGIPPSTAADLVMPRMRAVAGAYYLLVNTFIGLALGPYVMGQISDYYAKNGMDGADALRRAISLSLLIFIPTLIFLTLAWRHLPKDEASRLDRARALGEPVQESV